MTHCLKTWPEYYKAIIKGEKTFDARINDRDFKVGDVLILQEFDPDKMQYTRQEEEFSVTYILKGGSFGIQEGFVVLGIKVREHY